MNPYSSMVSPDVQYTVNPQLYTLNPALCIHTTNPQLYMNPRGKPSAVRCGPSVVTMTLSGSEPHTVTTDMVGHWEWDHNIKLRTLSRNQVLFDQQGGVVVFWALCILPV